MCEEPEPATGEALPVEGRRVELLVLLGIFALWIIMQVWVLPKAGVPT